MQCSLWIARGLQVTKPVCSSSQLQQKNGDTELEFSGGPLRARAAGFHNVVGDVAKGWPFPAITALF
ncbi:hypothetical protein GCM10011297_34560 [Bacterioplanes sanyensis]|nr:hypothetical protein GCM10011297_34560 [Bacterioplanes sanyensis]